MFKSSESLHIGGGRATALTVTQTTVSEHPPDYEVHGVTQEDRGREQSRLMTALNRGTPTTPGMASGGSIMLHNEEKGLTGSHAKMRTVLRNKTITSEERFSK